MSTATTVPSKFGIIIDLRRKAGKELATSLFKLANRRTKWERSAPLGFNSTTSWDIGEQINRAYYGKNTDFQFTVLASKDDHPIIAYFKPGSIEYGYGVMDEDGGDFCLEVTTHDLAGWILGSNPTDQELTKNTALLHKVVQAAAALSK